MTQQQLHMLRGQVLDAIEANASIDARGILTINIPPYNILALNAIHEICVREIETRMADEVYARGGAS